MIHPSTAEFLVVDHQRELLEEAGRSRRGRRGVAGRIWRRAGRAVRD